MKSKSFKSWVGAFVLAMTAFGALAWAPSQFGGTDTADAKGKPSVQARVAFSMNQSDVSLGDSVTFSFDASVARAPRVQIMCYQAGTLVYGEAGPADQAFLLGGGMSDWLMAGGAADCTATLYHWDFHPEQTFVPHDEISFPAGG